MLREICVHRPWAVNSPCVIAVMMIVSIVTITNTRAAENPQNGAVKRDYKLADGTIGFKWFNTKFWFLDREPWDGHKTAKNDKRIGHHHVQENWPKDGVTKDDAKRYYDDKWKDHMPGAPSAGDADPRYNCYSFAFGYDNMWIQEDGYTAILDNDYDVATKADAVACAWSAHVCKVTGRAGAGGACRITQITQKDRGSAIFTFNYGNWDMKLAPFEPDAGQLIKKKP